MSESPSLLSTTTTGQPTHNGIPCATFSAPSTSDSGEWESQPHQKQPGQRFINRITRKVRQQVHYQFGLPDEPTSRADKLRYMLRAIDIKVEVHCYKVYRAAARMVQKKP